MSDLYYHDFWRMDWGLGNPNKTAALAAMLAVAAWAFAYYRRSGFWVALSLSTILSVCLVHTYSRGGLVALIVGLIPPLIMAPRNNVRRHAAPTVLAIAIVVGAVLYLKAHERYGQGIAEEDPSITNRLILWEASPAMIVDAPEGWGLGRSGASYSQWYQPLDRHESYRTMVNSHLTWMVELGWGGRFLYVAGWLFVLLLCWPGRRSRILAIPLGIWMAFGCASIFSSVAESVVLWTIPVFALGFAGAYRTFKQNWPNSNLWIIPPLGATLICLSIYALGVKSGSGIRFHRGLLVYGDDNPEYVVYAEEAVLGKSYGRTLRETTQGRSMPTIALSERIEVVASLGARKVVLTGIDGATPSNHLQIICGSADQLIIINPMISPSVIGMEHRSGRRITVFVGEFALLRSMAAWCAIAEVQLVTGAAEYIPSWPDHILR